MVDVVGNSFPVVLNVDTLERKRKVGFSELLLFQKDEQRVLKTLFCMEKTPNRPSMYFHNNVKVRN